MTFDLHFFRAAHLPTVTAESVSAWAAAWPQIRRDGQNAFQYLNKFTGVTFKIELAGPPAGAFPDGLRHAGLRSRMEVQRPSFFGLEAAPVLEDLGQRLELWAVESASPDPAPQFLTAEWFLRAWTRAHRNAAVALSHNFPRTGLYTAREEQARAFWDYMSGYPEFSERSAKAGFFAPRMFLMARHGAADVQTAVTLIPDAAQVLPRTDLAMVVADRTRLFRIKKEVDVFYAPMSEVLQLLSPWLFEFEARPELLMLRRDDVAAAFERLARYRYPWTRRDFTAVNPEQIVDSPSLQIGAA